MPLDVNAMAAEVVLLVKQALAPVLDRLDAAEARLVDADKNSVRIEGYTSFLQRDAAALGERVAVVETKAAQPVLPPDAPMIDLLPILTRISTAEARLETLGDVRDRLVAVEVKADMPTPEPATVDLAPVLTRLDAVEQRPFATKELWDAMSEHAVYVRDTLGALRERVAVVEVRPSIAGPQGEQGLAGKDAVDGKDGAPGLSYEGVYIDGAQYDKGHCVTFGGSLWHCNEQTTTKPGDGSKAWQLCVKRGRDGRDGVDALRVPVVSVGKP